MVFTVGGKYYYTYYFIETTGHKKTAAYQCYYDKTSKSYVIPMAVLKSMVGYQYYKLPYNDYYGKQGYKGMFFCSTDLCEPSKEIMLTDNLADQIVAEEVTKNMTDVEKAKALNDYMGLHCDYDYTYSKYTPYDILVTGQGVCEAYAEAYHLLLTKAGIKDYVVHGSAGTDTLEAHAWNIVKLGKDYYHVDTTWNKTGYGYFLLSDKTISEDHVWDSSRYPACNKGLPRNDGRRVEILGDDFYSVIEDYDNNHFSLLRTKYDGTDRTILLKIEYLKYSPVFCFDDNNFYYATWDEGIRFFKLDLKMNAIEEILSDSNLDWDQFAVHDEYIYMYNRDRIIRMSMKTREQQNLYEETADNVNIFYLDIVDDRVIFHTSKYDETPVITKRYQMNLDGTGLNKLSR
jgi:transglutaminase-like putative cysteine protease